MFLNYSPNIEASLTKRFDKFSLPYSLAFTGLIHQLSIGTMGMLRLPSPVSVPSVSLGLDTIYGIVFSYVLCQVTIHTWHAWTELCAARP
jgi:hypothetical protein